MGMVVTCLVDERIRTRSDVFEMRSVHSGHTFGLLVELIRKDHLNKLTQCALGEQGRDLELVPWGIVAI